MFAHRLSMLLCVSLLALPACSNGGRPPNANDHVLRMAIPQDAKTLNPILVSSTVDASVQRLMFEPLISADSAGREVPILAVRVPTPENGGISRDGLTITYRLRSNVYWSDGVPVTSKDVAFSWTAVMNPDNDVVSRHGYDDIARIDIPSDKTVIVHLRKPLASFVDTFFAESDSPMDVIPAHVLERYLNLNQVPFNDHPSVSDGPFKFVRWIHGDRLILSANDRFVFGKPKLRGIDVLTVANENTATNMLRTGAVDYMYQASIVTFPQLRTIPGVHIVPVDMNGYEGLVFNLRRKPMSDPRFRQAVAYAVDKGEFVRTLTYGQEKIATEDLPDWMWAADRTLQPVSRDLARARALLRAAGVRTVTLTLVTDTANVTHKREAVLLQSMLREAGITLEIKTYPGDLLYAPAGMGGIVNGGKFDLALYPWYAGLDPDNSSQFLCANAAPRGYNASSYCSRRMDELQNAALTHYERAKRKSAYTAIERLLARDNPLLVFWWQRQQEALRTNVSGFAPNPAQETWNAWQWSK